MLVDWFTVAAQALNFLVLVWLMRRYLYKPIIHAIDAREARVAAELADADARKAEAKDERDAFLGKKEAFDRDRSALVAKATQEAEDERSRLIVAARREAEALGERRAEARRSDARALNEAVTRRTQAAVFDIARKALRDLATVELEAQIGDVFARQLCALAGPAKEQLELALATGSEPAVLRSAFELPEAVRERLRDALSDTLSTEVDLRFEVAPAIISGVEVVAGSRKVSWNIAAYLASVEEGVATFVEEPLADDEAEATATATATRRGGASLALPRGA